MIWYHDTLRYLVIRKLGVPRQPPPLTETFRVSGVPESGFFLPAEGRRRGARAEVHVYEVVVSRTSEDNARRR